PLSLARSTARIRVPGVAPRAGVACPEPGATTAGPDAGTPTRATTAGAGTPACATTAAARALSGASAGTTRATATPSGSGRRGRLAPCPSALTQEGGFERLQLRLRVELGARGRGWRLRGIRRGEGTAVEVGDGDRCARGGAHLGTAVGTRSPAAPSPPSARAQAAALAGGVGQVLGVELASLIRQPEIVGLPLEVVQLGVEAGQEGADAVHVALEEALRAVVAGRGDGLGEVDDGGTVPGRQDVVGGEVTVHEVHREHPGDLRAQVHVEGEGLLRGHRRGLDQAGGGV